MFAFAKADGLVHSSPHCSWRLFGACRLATETEPRLVEAVHAAVQIYGRALVFTEELTEVGK